jgi:hypothetical protein
MYIMKKLLALALITFTCATAQATVTINLGGGYIYFADGLTRAPMGSLVQLIASTTDNVFTAPTPDSFTGNSPDDLVLASFFVNVEPGLFLQDIIITFSGTLGPGDQLLLRWFPTLTSAGSGPGAGTQYGQFRTELIENNSTINWNLPPDGQTHDLQFVTMALGGTRSEAEGAANLVVVPDPSTYALMAVGLVGLVIANRRRKQNAVA